MKLAIVNNLVWVIYLTRFITLDKVNALLIQACGNKIIFLWIMNLKTEPSMITSQNVYSIQFF